MSDRNYAIDLFKFVFSLMVIGIHTNLFYDVNENLSFFFRIIFSIAVPFFAVCSGYFLSRTIEENNIVKVKNQEIKLIKLYTLWSFLFLIYSIPRWISYEWFSFWAFVDFGIATVRSASHYHLWYLLSLIYALPVFYLCVKYIKNQKIIFSIVAILYIIKVLTYAYRNIVPNFISSFFTCLEEFGALFNAIFLILPFMLLGYNISKGKAWSRKNLIIGFAISFALLCCEAYIIKSFDIGIISCVFGTFPVVFFVFSFIMQINWKPKNKKAVYLLGASSLVIYCLHPMIIEILINWIESSVGLFVLTAIISGAASIGFILLKCRIMKTFRKQKS